MSILPPDPVYCLKGDMGHVHSMCFPKINECNSSQLLAATEKGFVYFWDLETNRLQHKQKTGESIQAIHSVDFNIITQEKNGLVKLFKVTKSKYEPVKNFTCHGGFCKSIIFKDQIILPQENSRIVAIDTNNFEITKDFIPTKENLGNVMCLETVQIGENKYILAGYESGDVILYDFNTNKQCANATFREFITSITYDSCNRRGVIGNPSDALQIFSIDNTLDITLKCELKLTNEGCNVVKLRPDYKLFASGSWDGRIRLYSWRTLRVLVVLNEHKNAISDIQFSPYPVRYWDAKIMAASSTDGVISLWNLYNNYN